jgi:flagellar basal-body rod protein FlgG
MDALTISAASGMKSRMQSLDLLANNLANATTSGYKRDQEFYGLYSSDQSLDPATGGASSTLPVIERQWTDFSQGALQVTGNPLDIALSGIGFLAVKGPSGPLYTRNGNLQILPSGNLATSEGYSLLNTNGGAIHVAAEKPIQIETDGTVKQDGQAIGQLAVVTFPSMAPLSKMGNTCFQNTDPKSPATPAGNVEIQQGKIEGSNVPVAESAMQLVGVMRQFELLQKAIGINGEMDTKTIQEVARVGS